MTAQDVVNTARNTFLSGDDGSLYSDELMLSNLNFALNELGSKLANYGVSLNKNKGQEVDIVGTDQNPKESIDPPSGFISPLELQVKDGGSFRTVLRHDKGILPSTLLPSSYISLWTFRDNKIIISPLTGTVTIRLYYVKSLTQVDSMSDTIEIEASHNYLAAKISTLAAAFLGRQDRVAANCNSEMSNALRDLLGVYVKDIEPVRREGEREYYNPYGTDGGIRIFRYF